MHFPFGSKNFYDYSYEISETGYPYVNFVRNGNYGKTQSGSVMGELLNFAYAGVQFPGKSKRIKAWKIGLQVQRKIIINNARVNYFKITYYDEFGFIRGVEEFKGSHTAIDVVLSINF